MNLVAFNSSPRDNQTSKTELILQKFLEGARQAGAVTETLYLREYRIKYCLGCFGCWLQNKGRCVQEDDMTGELFGHFLEADLAVLATPLYHFNMNARMKSFIERTLPMMEPAFTDQGEGVHHPFRMAKVPRIAVLSVCAFPTDYNFQALSLNMRMLFGHNLVAEIYRHSSEFLHIPPLQPQVEEVLAAVVQAGSEVVRYHQVSPETMNALTRDLAPRETLIQMANQFWREEIEKEEGHSPPAVDDDLVDKYV
ncbi:MAG: flavodoxin family protein [Syntrophales bacterium]|nr:flavodoxin family protein [Syntrophales bacterium]MDD5643127.1 flavodoxin family protein [Syntrophales bacterium]